MSESVVKQTHSIVFRTFALVVVSAFLVAVIAVFIFQTIESKILEEKGIATGYSILDTFIEQSKDSIEKGQRKSFQIVMDNIANIANVEETALYSHTGLMIYKSREVTVGFPFVHDPETKKFYNPSEKIYQETRGRYVREDWRIRDLSQGESCKKYIRERNKQELPCTACHYHLNESLQFNAAGRAHQVFENRVDFFQRLKVEKDCVICHTHWNDHETAGYLRVTLDKQFIHEQESENLVGIGSILTAALIPSFIMIVFIFRNMVGKLNQRDEHIGQILTNLEEANVELAEANQLKEEYNKILEQKVSERTHELKVEKQYTEQQLFELQASYNKLEDLDNLKERFLEQMNSLSQTHFPYLREKLETLLDHPADDPQKLISQAVREMHTIDETLVPFQSLYLSEQAIQSKNVLLADTEKKQQIIAKMALGGTGVELDIASSLEEGLQLLEEKVYDIICTNAEMIELSERAVEQYPEIKSVFMTSDDASTYLATLQQYPFLSNIVSRIDEDRTFTLKNITTTIRKLITNDYFGLEKYLNWGVEVHEIPVTGSKTRSDLVDQMEEDFQKLGVRKQIINKCSAVAEELMMNAIYDAPIDAEGNSLYNHLPRTTEVVLNAEEQGVFRYACDGLLVAISVKDPFGAFGRDTILHYLESCYKGRSGSLQEGKGGAGRGLFYIMETADLMVFNIKPKIQTEVIAIFNIDPNKPKRTKGTSFHYFYQEKQKASPSFQADNTFSTDL
ncbi:MAG: hypothetical protein HQM14_02920 [SAR324 cluster bacterium]|nr:hypothetical protein [SAR324 cluster bacterium]